MCQLCRDRKDYLRRKRNDLIKTWCVRLACSLILCVPVIAFAMLVRGPSARPSKAFMISIEIGRPTYEPLAPKTPAPTFNAGDSLDPLMDPSNADRIFRQACADTKWRWPGDLVGIHIRESNGELGGDGGRAGGCNGREQMTIRALRDPSHLEALNDMKRRKELGLFRIDWDPDTVRGSCGTSTLKKRTGNYGGCIGPMQVSLGEWVKDDDGFYADKDPLNLYWSVRHTAYRLQRVYLSRLKTLKKARSGRMPSNPRLARVVEQQMEEDARNFAIRAYRGSESSDLAYDYQYSVRRTSSYYEVNPHMVEMRVRRFGKPLMYANADSNETIR